MLAKIFEYLKTMTIREKILLVGGLMVVIFLLLQSALSPVSEAFANQEKNLRQTRDRLALLPGQLERYILLQKRRQKIEEKYQTVDFKEGVLSHIEELIRTQAKVDNSTDYKINPLPEREFGGDYMQEPFRIELYTTSVADLTQFLQELVKGKRPLVLTRLDIKKAPNRSKLIVQLDVSNFRKIA